jgi:hypothetical protein
LFIRHFIITIEVLLGFGWFTQVKLLNDLQITLILIWVERKVAEVLGLFESYFFALNNDVFFRSLFC